MLRMITYGDGDYGSGMNTYLNSAASPDPRCVSRRIAIENGTSPEKMAEFEERNQPQTYPFTDQRLIPVWPVAESQISTMCTPPYDSRTVQLPAGGEETRDSFVAGYDYNIEGAPSWFHWRRGDTSNVYPLPGSEYDYDEGIWYSADPLPAGAEPRSAVVVVTSTKNESRYNALQHPCDTVCARARLTIIQGKSSGDYIAQYTNIDTLNISFGMTNEAYDTYPNMAVIINETDTSGAYFANGTTYGTSIGSNYSSLVSANGTSVSIDIAGLKTQFPDSTGLGGNITLEIYGSWEGTGNTSNIIPVPTRTSWSVDLIPNSETVNKASIRMDAAGNMNIGEPDIDSVSSSVDKLRARCSHIATVVYSHKDGTTTITEGSGGGIAPIFYPSTLNGQSGKFVWMESGSSKDRTFEAIAVGNELLTIGVTNEGGSGFVVYPSTSTAADADSYNVNGTTITEGQEVTVSGSSFTIDLSDSTKYPKSSTHRFYLRQVIPNNTLTSGNASPEYAYIQFTIN